MGEMGKNILCIDDHHDTCELVEFYFRDLEYKVSSCNTAGEGLKHARQGGFAAIILDNRFDDTEGIDVCKEIRSFDKTTPIVFFSGEARHQEIEKALNAGANAYLVKPNDFDKLTSTVINLIEETQQLTIL